jgi:alpha-tubulin suppressor-like RCC1 family protein
MRHLFFVVLFVVTIQQYSFAQTWIKISAGSEFSVALRSDGTLWSWGFNGNGQLGQGDNNPQLSPVQIGSDNDWVDIATGSTHALAVKKDGSLWAWGYNGDGELGDGSISESDAPEQIGSATDWSSVGAASATSFAIKKDHSLWAWGYNGYGTVGDGTTAPGKLDPTQVGTATNWTLVRGGGFHVMALQSDHSLWGWGNNSNGELGRGTTSIDSLPHLIGTDKTWTDISCGFEFSIGLKSDGSLWSWGFNGNGQLGLGSTTQSTTPKQIGTTKDWKAIGAGSSFAFAIKTDGSLWGWGYNGVGNLGDGGADEQDSPELIGTDKNWLVITGAKGLIANSAVIGLHTIALHTDAKNICATGVNYSGQLGNGSQNNVADFDCSVGELNAVARTPDGSVQIMISPNPATDHVTISSTGLISAHLEIFNILGEKIFASDFVNELQWNAAQHHNGSDIYMLRISGKTNGGEMFVGTRQLVIRN